VIDRKFKGKFRPDINRVANEVKELVEMLNGMPMFHDRILNDIGVRDFTSEKFNLEFANHINRYRAYLQRKEQLKHTVAVIRGLLSDLERKSLEPIAFKFEKPSERRNLNNFMTIGAFDHEGMLAEYRNETLTILSHPEGMVTGDGCDFQKKGNCSVGVARQYCGRLGKVDNCQSSVMVGYSSVEGYGLLDYELYMPKQWLDDDHKALRDQNFVPENIEFKTKNQLMSEMINKIVSHKNFKGKYIGVDCSFGHDHVFLDSLPEDMIYFADIPNTHRVFASRPDIIIPEYHGKGRRPVETTEYPPVAVKDFAADPSVRWRKVVLGMGAKGPIFAMDKCIKVVELRDGKPGKDVWLYIRKLDDDSVKYSLCNESVNATRTMIRIPALMRWSIEQCFNECKEHLGMDHYEVRSWTGWRRHILFTLIAHLFIVKLRRLFSLNPSYPGPAPVPESPVPQSDYLKAYSKFQKGLPVNHPEINSIPKRPQQVMTIGLVKKVINQYNPKTGDTLAEIEQELKQGASAFKSHTKTKLQKIIDEKKARKKKKG
jgi:SRSO17 transposase